MNQRLIDELEKLNENLFSNDFLLTWEKSVTDIKAVITCAEILKNMHYLNKNFKIFDSGLAVSVFKDNSTRTRFSFASACNALGLAVSDLDEQKSQIAHGETVRETAVMMSFLTEVVGIRDDIFLGEGHKFMQEVSSALKQGYEDQVLHHKPTLINLQSDLDHPTQTLSDLLKLKHFVSSKKNDFYDNDTEADALEKLRGKKIAISWAYSPSYGKPLSVPQGLISLMSRFGMNISLAYPESYELIPEIAENAKRYSTESGGNFEIVNSMQDAFQDADFVYPKSWAPFEVMQKRTELLKNKDKTGLNSLEKECLVHNEKFKNWECNSNMMKLTNNALYMHCLPADISGVSCTQGEVSEDVFDKFRNHTYHQASYKPFVIAAMILMSKIKNPAKLLRDLQN